jgi:hypothetical protein
VIAVRRVALVITITAVALVAGTASGAAAGGRHRVDSHSFGTYTVDGTGAAAIDATATGAPFDGVVTATLAADDGTLPAEGACEPATVTVRLDGSRERFVELTARDDVCGEYPTETYVVSHVFTGRYLVTDTSQRRLQGTEGFLSVRLAVDGRASVFAIDT